MSAFVYGTLMYPQVLQALIRRVPRMEPAVIHGFQRHPIRGQVGCAAAACAGAQGSAHGAGHGRRRRRGSTRLALHCRSIPQVFPGAVPASADSFVAGHVLFDLEPAEMEVRGAAARWRIDRRQA